jgi:hypothetical protein
VNSSRWDRELFSQPKLSRLPTPVIRPLAFSPGKIEAAQFFVTGVASAALIVAIGK